MASIGWIALTSIMVLPYPSVGFFAKLQNILRKLRVPIDLGDLQQQVIALQQAKNFDLIYVTVCSHSNLLQYLRALGLLNIPIITLIHSPYRLKRLRLLRLFQRYLLQGADILPCLSSSTLNQIAASGVRTSKLSKIDWGVDVDFWRMVTAW